MQTRKKGRKRMIKLIKNQQQIAQDKLHEISCQNQDKFVDESQMLSIEQNKKDKQFIQKTQQYKSITNIIDRSRIKQNKIKSEAKKKELSIQNKLQSQQVFVGVKFLLENRPKESYNLLRQIQRAKSTFVVTKCLSKSIPIRKQTTQLCQKLYSKTLELNTIDIHIKSSIYFLKRKDMSRQSHKLQNIRRRRTNNDLLFDDYNRNDRNRFLSHQTRVL